MRAHSMTLYPCMRRHGSTNPKHIAREKYRDEHAPGPISLHQQRVLSTQRRIIIIRADVVSPYTDPVSASTRLMRQSTSHQWRSIICYQLIGQVTTSPAPHGLKNVMKRTAAGFMINKGSSSRVSARQGLNGGWTAHA